MVQEVGHAKLRERGIDLIAADNPCVERKAPDWGPSIARLMKRMRVVEVRILGINASSAGVVPWRAVVGLRWPLMGGPRKTRRLGSVLGGVFLWGGALWLGLRGGVPYR